MFNRCRNIWGVLYVVIFILSFVFAMLGKNTEKQTYLDPIPSLLIGLAFLLSYYFPNNNFLFRGLMWLCVNFSTSPSKKMAFFYFGLGVFLAIAILINGLIYN